LEASAIISIEELAIKILKIIFIINLLIGNSCYANDIAAVLGYQNASNDELWQQKQIGFGAKNLLQQALLDKTNYSLLDDKIVLGIGKENIEEQLQEQWMLTENQTTADALKKLVEKHNLAHVYWVKITDFETKTSKISFAFLNSSEYKDTLTLEVCHYTATNHLIDCQEGEATQSRTLTGVLYTPADKVNFSESGAGRLSQEAITQSLTKLLPHE